MRWSVRFSSRSSIAILSVMLISSLVIGQTHIYPIYRVHAWLLQKKKKNHTTDLGYFRELQIVSGALASKWLTLATVILMKRALRVLQKILFQEN